MRPSSVIAPATLSVCALWLAACHRSIPEQVLSKPVPAVANPARPVDSGPWAYHPAAQRRAYVVDQHAVLSIRQDSLVRVDSVSSHSELAFTIFVQTNHVTGSLTVFRVQNSAHEPVTPSGLVLPFSFGADYLAREQQLVFSMPGAASPCSSPGVAVVQSLRDLWFQVPDSLRLGMTWSDSSSYSICRDGLPLRATVRRSFRVTGAAERVGRMVLTLSRASRTTLEGEGNQSGEPVSVTGSGIGEHTYTLDPAGGELLSARGSSTLDLTLRSRLRTQRVRQAADIRIDRSA